MDNWENKMFFFSNTIFPEVANHVNVDLLPWSLIDFNFDSLKSVCCYRYPQLQEDEM